MKTKKEEGTLRRAQRPEGQWARGNGQGTDQLLVLRWRRWREAPEVVALKNHNDAGRITRE